MNRLRVALLLLAFLPPLLLRRDGGGRPALWTGEGSGGAVVGAGVEGGTHAGMAADSDAGNRGGADAGTGAGTDAGVESGTGPVVGASVDVVGATDRSYASPAGLPSPGRDRAGRPAPTEEMVPIPAGRFVPLFLQEGESAVEVDVFLLDRRPVTRGEFLEFVRTNPRWRRGEVPAVFAEAGYLASWPAELDAGGEVDRRRAVTQVSWFAAKAYCESRGARLPTVDEWEYVAAASRDARDATDDPAFLRELLELYTRPAAHPLSPVGTGSRNVYGVEGMHGPVREWVLDFNTVMVSDDSRGVGVRDRQLYCAGGAVGATRTEDYAAFLRYTYRSGLTGRSVADNLGFRCAREVRP